MPYLKNAFDSKNFKRMYPADMLDINDYNERNQCPVNDRLCNEEVIWLPQNLLLAGKSDMEEIATAIGKIYDHAAKIMEKK